MNIHVSRHAPSHTFSNRPNNVRNLAQRTIGMPNIRDELHLRRREGIVLGKLELGGENTAFEWCAFGALDERFPEEHVVFRDGAGGYALGRIGGEGFVLFEEAFGS
jgi:hypothetical protein